MLFQSAIQDVFPHGFSDQFLDEVEGLPAGPARPIGYDAAQPLPLPWMVFPDEVGHPEMGAGPHVYNDDAAAVAEVMPEPYAAAATNAANADEFRFDMGAEDDHVRWAPPQDLCDFLVNDWGDIGDWIQVFPVKV